MELKNNNGHKVDYDGEPWIGVDLDGVLAEYHGWKGEEHIGEPIPSMVFRIKEWIQKGIKVKIFTARACNGEYAIKPIKEWCIKVGLPELEVTNAKDYGMIECWDDRSVQMVPNTGLTLAEYMEGMK